MFTGSKTFPAWALLSLATNGLLMLAVILLLLREHWLPASSQASVSATQVSLLSSPQAPPPNLGPRHQLNYDQWVALLGREASVAATQQPKHLTILAGDSLSLWFPTDLLPPERTWLNQGISGETSAGLLRRLDLFDETKPEVIFVMIGINDLIRGVKNETILANQRQIIKYLRRVHPRSQVVVQSILPHGGEATTWEGRDRLLAIPNSRIQEINKQLAAIAAAEGALYLDLHPLFADANGNLRSVLTSDGLHLSPQGYMVWRSALQVFAQFKIEEAGANSQPYRRRR
ncbi:SGNH/GDSL hydrolase family protein [Microcoleus sp. FACHB-831]|uniref:SGNH/GDSL hydrolase family protein n=1 Tax=Microcoleus sp. FACHB-831 TaxID=2692827 RepID=UPI0035C88402